MTAHTDDPRLEQLTTICLAHPGAVREDMSDHAAFLVRGKKFAYFLDDHHGDGVVAAACRAVPGEQEALLVSGQSRFIKPAYLGARGWIGMRLDLGDIDWDEIADFVADSYTLAAARRARNRE